MSKIYIKIKTPTEAIFWEYNKISGKINQTGQEPRKIGKDRTFTQVEKTAREAYPEALAVTYEGASGLNEGIMARRSKRAGEQARQRLNQKAIL